jgi:hypothetical protein
MGNLITGSDVSQRTYFERIEICRIRFLAVIDEPEITLNVDSIFPLPSHNKWSPSVDMLSP